MIVNPKILYRGGVVLLLLLMPLLARGSESTPYPPLPGEEVAVRFHPQPGIEAGKQPVVFALPLGRGWLREVPELELRVGKSVRPVDAEALGRWPDGSLRALRIRTRLEVEPGRERAGTLRLGKEGEGLEGPFEPVAESWIPSRDSGVDESEYTTMEIREPAVYTTLPAEWLTAAALRSRGFPARPEDELFDRALLGYSRTAVNDVPDGIPGDKQIDVESDASAWLFDRASTLWGVYFRTGEVKWLRHA
ncbi:MAG: hypothetical protein ACLFVF_05085, partial [Thiohalospira sp.]